MQIIAGVGLNSFDEKKIHKLVLAGADVLRYNFSYNNPEKNIKYIKDARKVIDELNASTKILVDMPTNKIRLGDFDLKILAVRESTTLIFKSGAYSHDCHQFIPVNVEKLGKKVKLSETITIGDGEIALHVQEIIDEDTILVQILNNGAIQYGKTFNIEYKLPAENIIEKYRKILDNIKTIDPDFIAISYLDSNIYTKTRELIKDIGRAKIIVKIENNTDVENIEKILSDKSVHAILLDRGEMAVNMPFEKLGIIQKDILKKAKNTRKNVIMSTQILESTINNYIPYRSEIENVTNMVEEKIYGVMLCQETTFGSRPAYSVNVLKKIITAVEKNK